MVSLSSPGAGGPSVRPDPIWGRLPLGLPQTLGLQPPGTQSLRLLIIITTPWLRAFIAPEDSRQKGAPTGLPPGRRFAVLFRRSNPGPRPRIPVLRIAALSRGVWKEQSSPAVSNPHIRPGAVPGGPGPGLRSLHPSREGSDVYFLGLLIRNQREGFPPIEFGPTPRR